MPGRIFEKMKYQTPKNKSTGCNDPVAPVPKEGVAGRVPPYVFATQTDFVRCPRCQRIYWPATHAERVRREIASLAPPLHTRPGAG